VQACFFQIASLREVKAMQKQERKEARNEGNKENKIQVIFLAPQRDYKAEMKRLERKYHDTDGWLDKDYLVIMKIDEKRLMKD
jgi:hypothetical protein